VTEHSFRNALQVVFASVLLSACSLEPRYTRPDLPIPDSWPAGDAYLQQSEASLPSISYPDVFKDRRLQALIETAVAHNRDLRATVANVEATRAQYRVQRAGQLPGIALGADVTHRNANSGTNAGSTYTADVGANAFELDLFQRVRSLSRAAIDRYLSTEAGARATRIALVGEVAVNWLNYAADSSLIAIAQETVTNAERSVELTRARLQGGIAPRTDLRQAEIILNQALADLAEDRTSLAQDHNALSLLVGAPIDAALLPESIDSVVGTLAEVPAGLDSSVLLRRPDVMQAEYQLQAANAEIGAARAALFPRISLGALLGYSSKSLETLFTRPAETSSTSAGISLPLFTGGAALAGLAQVRAEHEVAVARYEQSLQTAFREVADALARRGTIADQEASGRSLVEAALDNYRLADARYRGGIESFMPSLDARRSLYSAQRSLVMTRLARADNLVTLYRALGGDSQLQTTGP
jgi:outer membrane protein, multidrug efflux system